jgi:hypothetical protein
VTEYKEAPEGKQWRRCVFSYKCYGCDSCRPYFASWMRLNRMVRINYEQMEQLRECKLEMRLPLSSTLEIRCRGCEPLAGSALDSHE